MLTPKMKVGPIMRIIWIAYSFVVFVVDLAFSTISSCIVRLLTIRL